MTKLASFISFDFPNMATHCSQDECGFSLYRGVLVQWDEDHDTRVLEMLDSMPAAVLDRLVIVQEHEGSVSFRWSGPVPRGYREHDDGIDVDGDYWSIYSSYPLATTTKSGRGVSA